MENPKIREVQALKRLTWAACLALLLAGCATTNQVTVAQYKEPAGKKLPPVTVFYQQPSESFRRECEEYDRDSLLKHCQLNRLDLGKFASELSDTGAFEEVLYANQEVPYQIRVTTAYYNTEGGDDLASAAFSGATMMIAPMIISADIKVDASLYWYEFKLKEFRYDLPIEYRSSLLSMNQDTASDIARSIASHILRDIQAEDIFSAQYLTTALNSSDYQKDLSLPDQAGDYFLQETRTYDNPLYGAYALYGKDTQETDYMEVFIYPVRAGHWSDNKGTIETEIQNIKKDAELFNKENALEILTQSETEFVAFPQPAATITAGEFESDVLDSLSNEYVTRNYLMIMEDKFFRVRHTALKGAASSADVQATVAQLVQDSTVPKESLFMARLRKQWRDTQALQVP
jgi:hypothetical protein